MKVAVVTQSESNGGAAIIASRLSKECGKYVEIRLFSQDAMLREANSKVGRQALALWSRIKRKIAGLLELIDGTNHGSYKSYGLFRSRLLNEINQWKPDVVHLHWVGGELLSIEDIGRIKSPIVWTMHDCWPIVGSEHHITDTLFAAKRVDLHNLKQQLSSVSYWVLKRKKLSYSAKKIVYACPSKWVEELVQQSPVSSISNKVLIANGVDTNLFRPYGEDVRIKLRKTYQIPAEASVVLIGSMTNQVDPVKGFDLFLECLEYIECKAYHLDQPIIILTLGVGLTLHSKKVKIVNLGRVASGQGMADVYNISNVTCIPSRVETHSMMGSESICCGTPVAAFDVAGNDSVITNGKTGFLARPFDAKSLAKAISQCNEINASFLKSEDLLDARQHFCLRNMANSYLDLYRSFGV